MRRIGDHVRVGVDMVTLVLTLPRDRDPDWDIAARAVRDVQLAVVWDTGDLYPWEDWLRDVEWLPGAVSAFVAMRAAQGALHGAACELRGAIEHGWPAELIVFETPTHRVWVTGGPSVGDPPGDLFEPARWLTESGMATAATFDDYTRYIDPPIGERTLDFSRDEVRVVRLGVAAAHVADQAAGIETPATSGEERFDAWLAELDGVRHAGEPDGRALLCFAARGLALSAWLKHPAEPITAQRLDERARELSLMADEGGLDERPRRQSWSIATRDCRRAAEDIGGWFDVLGDPGSHDDEDVRSFTENAGGTLGEAIEIELMAHVLFKAVVALADLCGDEVAALLDVPPAPIIAKPPRGSRRGMDPVVPLVQRLTLVMVGQIDWAAGAHALDTLPPDVRDERRTDLAKFERVATAGEYQRWATSQNVGEEELLIAAPHGGYEPDVAVSIGRLARDGILDAAGATWWSVPDPDFRVSERSLHRRTRRGEANP